MSITCTFAYMNKKDQNCLYDNILGIKNVDFLIDTLGTAELHVSIGGSNWLHKIHIIQLNNNTNNIFAIRYEEFLNELVTDSNNF